MDHPETEVETCNHCGKWMGFTGALRQHPPKWEFSVARDVWTTVCPWCSTENFDTDRTVPAQRTSAPAKLADSDDWPADVAQLDADLDSLSQCLQQLATVAANMANCLGITVQAASKLLTPAKRVLKNAQLNAAYGGNRVMYEPFITNEQAREWFAKREIELAKQSHWPSRRAMRWATGDWAKQAHSRRAMVRGPRWLEEE